MLFTLRYYFIDNQSLTILLEFEVWRKVQEAYDALLLLLFNMDDAIIISFLPGYFRYTFRGQ